MKSNPTPPPPSGLAVMSVRFLCMEMLVRSYSSEPSRVQEVVAELERRLARPVPEDVLRAANAVGMTVAMISPRSAVIPISCWKDAKSVAMWAISLAPPEPARHTAEGKG